MIGFQIDFSITITLAIDTDTDTRSIAVPKRYRYLHGLQAACTKTMDGFGILDKMALLDMLEMACILQEMAGMEKMAGLERPPLVRKAAAAGGGKTLPKSASSQPASVYTVPTHSQSSSIPSQPSPPHLALPNHAP
jgi:hypothetical protein